MLPTVKKVVLRFACPPGPCVMNGGVPNRVEPSMKVTDPVIGGPPGQPTMAVSVTDCPWTDVLGLELKLMHGEILLLLRPCGGAALAA